MWSVRGFETNVLRNRLFFHRFEYSKRRAFVPMMLYFQQDLYPDILSPISLRNPLISTSISLTKKRHPRKTPITKMGPSILINNELIPIRVGRLMSPLFADLALEKIGNPHLTLPNNISNCVNGDRFCMGPLSGFDRSPRVNKSVSRDFGFDIRQWYRWGDWLVDLLWIYLKRI